jgi:hypothetical protein
MRTARSSPRLRFLLPAISAVRDPVIVCLLLAGFFDGISGNPIHSMLLFATAVALGWDRIERLRRGTEAAAVLDDSDGDQMQAELITDRVGIDHTVLLTVVVTGAVMYAVVVGGFARYSWPVTFAVLVPGALVLARAWRGPLHPKSAPGPIDPIGKVAWASIVVALSGWELGALFLQPTLSTDSYAHPTISTLTEAGLASQFGRSLALLVWLALGWFLLER